MKKIKKTTVFIMTLILSLLVIPIAGQEVYAAGGNISSLPVSIKAYPVSTANNTPAFANKGDGNKSGTIYAADLCTITRIDGDGWLIVNYPTSNNRTRTLFVKARDFFCATSFQEASISKYATAYRRSSGSESIGSVDAADRLVYVIGSSQNGRFQIVYRVTNSTYYKMGWVSADALSKTPSNQPSLTFSPSSVTLTEGTNGTVNVKFSGDGLKTLNVESSNTSVCTAYWSGTTDWKAGTTTLTVKGKKAGSANITVSFLNNSGKKFYSKSFSVTVENNRDVFNPIWPCAEAYYVNCLYYYKSGNVHSTKYGYKNAIDIGGGGNIVAVEKGTVEIAKDLGSNSFGKYVIILHDNGTRTLYAHLSSCCVKEGEPVSKGQTIGVMGSTGSDGIHLHFEMSTCDPFVTYYMSAYRDQIKFESNVRSNNAKYNKDTTIVNWIDSNYTKQGNYYVAIAK